MSNSKDIWGNNKDIFGIYEEPEVNNEEGIDVDAIIQEHKELFKELGKFDYIVHLDNLDLDKKIKDSILDAIDSDRDNIRRTPLIDIKLPVNTHKETLSKVSNTVYRTYCFLILNSHNGKLVGMEGMNYLYKNKLDEIVKDLEENSGFKISKRTLESHLKTLAKLEIPLVNVVNTPSGIAYQINFSTDGKYYKYIPYEILQKLVNFTNKDVIKLYMIFLVQLSTDSFKQMDRGYLARQTGLSDKAKKNLDVISQRVEGLSDLGLIEVKFDTETFFDKDQNKFITKTMKYYRLRTLEEYRQIREERKPKRISKTDKKI